MGFLLQDYLVPIATHQTKTAVAQYEWKSGHDGDLEFAAKGKIEVLSEHPGEGWWTGIVHGNPIQVLIPPKPRCRHPAFAHPPCLPPSLIHPVFRLRSSTLSFAFAHPPCFSPWFVC
jgi:hypothetical protein